MKLKNDPRHRLRVAAVKKLFEKAFRPELKLSEKSLAGKVWQRHAEIDKLITKNAPAWPLEQIPPMDLSTLRLAIWELIYKNKKEPYKAIIDEAIEVTKDYGNQSSPKFINGVLGSILKKYQQIKT